MTSNRRVATRYDHDKFCRTEGWQPVSNARGAKVAHHVTYELPLHDGRILRTRVSRPVDRTDYGASMWAHILRDQLGVTDAQFWDCIDNENTPDRGAPAATTQGLPAELVHLLLNKVGLSSAEVALMSKADAIARANRFWETGK